MNKHTRIPVQIGPIHFVGIGGIGMSGIAEVLLSEGFKVQGSDAKGSAITERLEEKGAKIFIGQSESNLEGAEVVVISSAIKPGNPELDGARALGLPVVRRAEMLAELMRLRSNVAVAGTHGKTTTTSLVSAILDGGGMDPTVINGGIIHAYGSNARMGQGEWMVVEADESDGTFNKLPATIAVITNIDPEHLDHYGDFETLKEAFHTFASNIPFYGVAVACVDHPEVQNLVGHVRDRKIITYGLGPQADIRAVNLTYDVDGAHFDITNEGEDYIQGVHLPMHGDHNVQNALAALAVGTHFEIEPEKLKSSLAEFGGVNRRFTKVGEWKGIPIIDDYAHHPVEIQSVLKAARQASKGRVLAFHQPHRYSRLASLYEDFCTCFNDADMIGITEVYAAGEEPIDGASGEHLVQSLQDYGHRSAHYTPNEDTIFEFIKAEAKEGDIVICCGAGSISGWARDLQARLDK